MGIRQTLNENPAITAAATAGIIVIALIFIIVELLPHHPKAGPPGKMFYSDDDGAHWFADDATKIPPFDHNGKPAVLAYVYKCGDTGQPFVGYLLKYTADGQKRMQDAQNGPNGHMMDVPPTAFNDTLVKKPGSDTDWVSREQDNGQSYMKVTSVTCPDGGTNLYPVIPDNK